MRFMGSPLKLFRFDCVKTQNTLRGVSLVLQTAPISNACYFQVISKIASAQEKQLIAPGDHLHLKISSKDSLVLTKKCRDGKSIPITTVSYTKI